MKEAKPFSYESVESISANLRLTEKAFNACARMWGTEIFELGAKAFVTGEASASLIRQLLKARVEKYLMVPVSFAAIELGLGESFYSKLVEHDGGVVRYINGYPYTSKEDYARAGGRALLSEDEREEAEEALESKETVSEELSVTANEF